MLLTATTSLKRLPRRAGKPPAGTCLLPDEEPLPVLQGLMKAYDEHGLEAYPVSKAVNKVSNDSPQLMEPFNQQYLL